MTSSIWWELIPTDKSARIISILMDSTGSRRYLHLIHFGLLLVVEVHFTCGSSLYELSLAAL